MNHGRKQRGPQGPILLFLPLLLFLTSCGVQSIPRAQNEVEAKWAEVINQYKRRADLVPNLVKAVKAYASHEKETLKQVTEARSRAYQSLVKFENLNTKKLQKLQQAQQGLAQSLSRLMMVSERYPDLKAGQNFRDLQTQLEGTENRIAVARNRYIEAVKEYNNQVTVPPTSWTNSLFYHYDKKPQFSVDNVQDMKKAPEVNL
mgnify:CR=1 FL=1